MAQSDNLHLSQYECMHDFVCVYMYVQMRIRGGGAQGASAPPFSFPNCMTMGSEI